jgi:hypothetical protein
MEWDSEPDDGGRFFFFGPTPQSPLPLAMII